MPESSVRELRRLHLMYSDRTVNSVLEERYASTSLGNRQIETQLRQHIRNAVARHLGGSLQSTRVLDVGCNDGGQLNRLEEHGMEPENFYGLDLMEDRIEKARMLHPRAHFVVGSVHDMPYQSEHFDVVSQFALMSSLIDESVRTAAAREMDRVLRPGGFILWYDFWINPLNADTKGIDARTIGGLFPGYHLHLIRTTLAPPLARRLGRFAPWLLRPLANSHVFDTHYFGLLRKAGAARTTRVWARSSAAVFQPGEIATSSSTFSIGYIVPDGAEWAAQELFQMMKVPAVHFNQHDQYSCVVVADSTAAHPEAAISLVFGQETVVADADAGLHVEPITETSFQDNDGESLTLSQGLAQVTGEGVVPFLHSRSGKVVAAVSPDGRTYRFGFDLISEVQHFLTLGQEEEAADVPTLDRLVDIVRLALQRHTLYAEIPPCPTGYTSIATLSHDIDQLSMRELEFSDRLLSVLYHSTVWPLLGLLQRKVSIGSAGNQLFFAAKVPFIMLGLLPDPWTHVDDYVALEGEYGAVSTFFFVPFANTPGVNRSGLARHRRRRVGYDLRRHARLLTLLSDAGAEIAVHGIDAWVDKRLALAERKVVSSLVGHPIDGLRIHWLYQNQNSCRAAEEAGFLYDSTAGFPRRSGFRTGTLGPFMPIGAHRLLEFPVHVEDGQMLLFNAAGLAQEEGKQFVDKMFDHASRYGGVLNVSWHDMSLFPPRSWSPLYRYILASSKSRGAWACRLIDAYRWSVLRRQIRFQEDDVSSNQLRVSVPDWPENLPTAHVWVSSAVHGIPPTQVDLPRGGEVLISLENGTVRVAS